MVVVSIVELKHVKKSFSKRQVLPDISFSLDRGKTLGLLGPNGAGKTTLLNLLTGQVQADAGAINICGFDPAKQLDLLLPKIGFIADHQALYEEFSTFQNLFVFAKLLGKGESEVEQSIEKFGLEEKAQTAVKFLSRGQRQRVLLARTLMHEPDLLILDEPTIGLDPIHINELVQYLKKLKSDDLTLIISTHHLTEVEKLCDMLLILQDGRICDYGSIEALGEKYREQIDTEPRITIINQIFLAALRSRSDA